MDQLEIRVAYLEKRLDQLEREIEKLKLKIIQMNQTAREAARS
jgi:chaperonin cofactor prefoldin